MFLTECICTCRICGRYYRNCICETEEQRRAKLQKEREAQQAYLSKHYRPGSIVYHKYDGTGRVVSVDLDRQFIEICWTQHSTNPPLTSWMNYQSCIDNLIILIESHEKGFSSEFKKGVIVEYVDAQHSGDRTKYNYSTGKFFGEIIHTTSAGDKLTVLWETGDKEEVHFKRKPFIKLARSVENTLFGMDLKSGCVINFTGEGPYAYIVEVAEDRRTMSVQWESYNGYPPDEPIKELSYLHYFAQNMGKHHSLTTTENRLKQLIYEDQLLEASLMNDYDDNYDDYDDYDGDY